MPDEIAADMQITPATLATVPTRNEVFMRELSGKSKRRATNLTYNFEIEYGGFLLQQSYRISPPEGYSKNLLEVEMTTELFTFEGLLVREVISRLAVKADCSLKQLSKTVIVVKMRPGQLVEMTRTEDELTKAPSVLSKVFPLATVALAGRVAAAKSVTQIRALDFFNGPAFDYIADEEGLPVVKTVVREAPVIRRFNPRSRKVEDLRGTEFEVEDAAYIQRNYESTATGYYVEHIKAGDSETYSDSVSRKEWLGAGLNSAPENKPIMSGFDENDFFSARLRYEIKGRGKPVLFNPDSYLSFEKREQLSAGYKWRISVDAIKPPKSVVWDAEVEEADQIYLRGSRWIELSEGDKIANELRPKLKKLNRVQVGKIIAARVNKLISYDDAALEDDVASRKSVSEILRNKKGVCQHFSVLFTAIARSLGIPTRMVSGWSLNASQPIAHTWVEIKIDEDTWWPLDPQYEDDRLTRRGYLPILEDRTYEAESEDPVSRLQNVSREASAWQPFNGANFSKIN